MFDNSAARARTAVAVVLAMLVSYGAALRDDIDTLFELAELRAEQKAQAGSVTQLVTIGATLFIGIVVLASIGDAMPDNVTMFSGAMNQVETILNSSFILAAILPLVIVAGAILFYVRGFGNSGGGMGGGR